MHGVLTNPSSSTYIQVHVLIIRYRAELYSAASVYKG